MQTGAHISRRTHRLGGRAGATFARRAWLAGLACFLFLTLPISSPAQVSKEYQVKAVFLFRLAQFVDWPTNAFENSTSPLIIGVLGEDPFGEALDLAVRGETANNRPIMTRRFRRGEEIGACHILFISQSEASRVRDVMAALAGRSILTVSDMEDFVLQNGGMVRFVTVQNKVNLRLDPLPAKAVGLEFNARLLRIAEVVKR